MGTTGLIFGAIVVAWLAYLVPMYLRRNQQPARPVSDPESRFSDSVQIIRDGSAPAVDQDLNPIDDVQISTPLTRRAAVTEICRTEKRMAARRRNVLGVLGLGLVTLIVLSAIGRTPWWSVTIPVVLIAAFVAIARVSVRAMHQGFEARLARIERGDEEDTVRISREELAKAMSGKDSGSVNRVEIDAPEGAPGTLWDPLPVTRPTYVQAPVAPRTVRTIDLAAPVSASEPPVTADGPGAEVAAVVEAEEQRPRPRAVGE
ncbi:hypothetical protein [Enemella evansiae]|uniref:Uncharacterized protein n=1 Tax=Enemella evansiae TaxID=2016499 RepID=A0A255GFA3_9ACTN|nr:hypothetical protein [Enemella evansiae]PFG66177.1 hypothetical protein B0O41_0958 [Propionibacteriaceae bacterium ES.041]OYN94982.1 hypothetical protein CGZ96_16110 [Enemella evansiae]OYO04822.1 hypothetical protein CGZ95_02815 [Enemella evansiae]OYO06473.1 hypothetical protein CGZ97_07600 [Enemella evansiae]OYO11644.1 hypothetical protein CGZ94_14575 [Enemella evansiae]